ncbi:unnamed protein product [Camellia sinensis]
MAPEKIEPLKLNQLTVHVASFYWPFQVSQHRYHLITKRKLRRGFVQYKTLEDSMLSLHHYDSLSLSLPNTNSLSLSLYENS